MGQRTAIIVQHVNNWCKKNEKETRVFYHGWGIGRVLPSQLLVILNGLMSVSMWHTGQVELLKPIGTTDVTDGYDPVEQALFDELDFDHPDYVGEILQKSDNNNGGLFVRITTNEQGDTEKVEFAAMLGYEEDGDYKTFCSLWDWMKAVDPNERCCDEKFREYVINTLTYFQEKFGGNLFDRSKGEPKEDGEKAA